MTLIQYLYLYLAAFGTFLVLDLFWLGIVARDFYRTHIGFLMGEVQWVPALIFYLLYIGGVLLFAVLPALETHSWTRALWLGAALGFLAYATYDLTNLATLKDWPVIVTVVDLVWGTVLTGSIAVATYFIASRFIL
jgi:uncharacterized membrane protein